jgi:hypothetical protein
MGLKRCLGVVLTMTWVGAITAFAQLVKSPVNQLAMAPVAQEETGNAAQRVINFDNSNGVSTEFIPPTALGESNPGSNEQTNWLKVELHYSVNPEHPDKYPWVDSVEFKIWIEGRDAYAPNPPPGSTEVAVCLTGEVTYINLAAARDCYGVFYVHPSALARYSGSGGYEDFDRKFNIHVEAYVGGKLVDYFDKNKNDPGGANWFKAPTAVPNVVSNQADSPFIVSNPNRYPETKSSTSSGAGQ